MCFTPCFFKKKILFHHNRFFFFLFILWGKFNDIRQKRFKSNQSSVHTGVSAIYSAYSDFKLLTSKILEVTETGVSPDSKIVCGIFQNNWENIVFVEWSVVKYWLCKQAQRFDKVYLEKMYVEVKILLIS